MGFFSSLFDSKREADKNLLVLRTGSELSVVGESHYQDAIAKVCGPKSDDGYNHLCLAILVPEPSNPYDKHAIKVLLADVPKPGDLIDPQLVGYLDRDSAKSYKKVVNRVIAKGDLPACEACVRGGWSRDGGGDQGHYGVTLDIEEPKYAHPEDPPRKQKKAPSVDDHLDTGASRADKSFAGLVQGKHYTEWVDTVKDLKRQGDYEAALSLLGTCCDAAEAESKETEMTLPPWYFEQIAIIRKKQKDYAGEIEILERYKQNKNSYSDRYDQRIEKAKALLAKQKV